MKETKMKRCIGHLILCTVLSFSLIFVSTVFAEMKKIDDKELASTNAPVTKGANQKSIPFKISFDNTSMTSFHQAIMAGDGFSLNLTVSPETWTYNLSTFNPNYWGGNVTGVRTSR